MNYQNNTKFVTLNFYSTPSHGYLQVHKNFVDQIEPCEALQSSYSFYDGETNLFYFEEDCDAPEIMKALKGLGYEINLEDEYDEHETIKTYNRLG